MRARDGTVSLHQKRETDQQRAVEELAAQLETWTQVGKDEVREQAESLESRARRIDESRQTLPDVVR